MTETKISLKLLINTETNTVLFAEAKKDFVDFLFSIMSLPIATIVELLEKQEMVGCLGDLYGSIEDLKDEYMQPQCTKKALLKPMQISSNSYPLKILHQDYEIQKSSTRPKGRVVNNEDCGFVKGMLTYMVSDNLVVTLMSTVSSLTLLKTYNLKDVNCLIEQEVYVGKKEALKLLKTSLQSKKVLTEVFINPVAESSSHSNCVIFPQRSILNAKLKVIAAYLLAVLGGNISPSTEDLKTVLCSVGSDADDEMIELLLSLVKNKDITELIAAGSEKMASVPSGGGGVGMAAPTGGSGGAASASSDDDESDSSTP